MMPVTLYRKDGCWLCDHAEELLNGLGERYGLHITKVDIASDDDLYELYRFDIPVLEFPDGSTLNGRIRKQDIERCIHDNQQR